MIDSQVTPGSLDDLLDRFFAHYYRCRPVNATFTGVHAYDHVLPDWSEHGLTQIDTELHTLRAELDRVLRTEQIDAFGTSAAFVRLREEPRLLDALLARNFSDVQVAEQASRHGPRGNPALWTGEAVFGVISLMIRDFAPVAERMRSACARMEAVPAFLRDATVVMAHAPIPDAWRARALRDCEGAERLFTGGVEAWIAGSDISEALAASLPLAAVGAQRAFAEFAVWLAARPVGDPSVLSCGPAMYDLLLSHGHCESQSRAALLDRARSEFRLAVGELHASAQAMSLTWEEAQQQMAAEHPLPDDYLSAFGRTWDRVRGFAAAHDVVTWPDWPIAYRTFPAATRDAAPYLYYLFYRSPAPFDPYTEYQYVVPPLPTDAVAADTHLRAWNQSAITLNHVVHHGAIGHHVQNWHAYHRAPTRIGRIAAVDCANRVGMFCAGTMAEGWACYATQLMDELGFLSALERLSEQHSRMRFLARTIVDIELHQGSMTLDDGIAFYRDEVGMSAAVARGEAVKNSMFPGTAIMYWLGTESILALRARLQVQLGELFSLKSFHDSLLGFGSIPVPLIARLMLAETT